ncbi:trehalose 6-phosphate synthase/phosphatase [Pancytospora epiphaga]|nr:trehalose 6-phosphate synthase/phosphatase [Pancytospora epiphaga]
MKVIYCSSSINIDDLKTMPSNYTSSKINTLFKKSEPYFIREFESISNIEYINVENYPDFYQIWNDMMNKMTFSYNYKYLESKLLFDDYVEFNKNITKKINEICNENDLLIINDASLYLLPEMVKCRTAVRNLDFDDCFIERIPYYERILRSLMKAQKFFTSKEALQAFKKYVDSSYELYETSPGGCHYLPVHVDKEIVLDVLNICSIYRNALNSPRFTVGSEIIDHLRTLTIPKTMPVLMTNVPLLHLEKYIKVNPRVNVRYIRSSVEIDDKQDRMVQYLKKAYGCNVDVIDNHCYRIIALEMFYCDIFIGSKYSELSKLLRKPYIEDDNDPEKMMEKIGKSIGNMEQRQEVFGVDQYLREFMELCGYDALQDSEDPVDNKIDAYVLELIGWISRHHVERRENDLSSQANTVLNVPKDNTGLSSENSSVSGSTIGISTTFQEQLDLRLNSEMEEEPQALYKKIIGGESIYYLKKPGDSDSSSTLNGSRRCSSPPEEITLNTEQHLRDEHSETNQKQKDNEGTVQITSPDNRQSSTKFVGIPKPVDMSTIASKWNNSNRIALLDYDGTLSEIQPLPHMAKPKEELFELIRAFNKRNKCIICTGRSKSVVDEWFPKEIEVFAEHGACFRRDGVWEENEKIDGLNECIEIMEYYRIRTPGTVVEKKSFGCAFHFKQAKGFDVEKLFFLLRRTVGKAVVLGKGVIEVRSSNKYDITKKVNPALVAGDDRVDEDMFEACDGISIRVGKGESKADWCVETVEEFKEIIRKLSE